MSSPQQTIIKKDGVWTVDGRPRETVEFISHHRPANMPGKSLITLVVNLPPNAATPPHTHSGAAISAVMLTGSSLNQMNCDEPKVYSGNEGFFEAPGCHHVRCENVSTEELAKFVAVMVVDDEVVEDGYERLVVLDADAEEKGEGKL